MADQRELGRQEETGGEMTWRGKRRKVSTVVVLQSKPTTFFLTHVKHK
jgi:hypothetical protein